MRYHLVTNLSDSPFHYSEGRNPREALTRWLARHFVYEKSEYYKHNVKLQYFYHGLIVVAYRKEEK